jgi:hypothetical protein
MGVVIDVHQAVKLTLGYMGFGSAEPQIPRLVRKSSDRGLEQRAVAPLERAHVDDSAVAELQSFGRLTGHAFALTPSRRIGERFANSHCHRVAVDPERKLKIDPMSVCRLCVVGVRERHERGSAREPFASGVP